MNTKNNLVPLAWVTADTVIGQTANGKPRRIWWENSEDVGIPIYTTPQPTPEVTKLVEALEHISNMDSMSYHSLETAKIVAKRAVTAYHKQRGEL